MAQGNCFLAGVLALSALITYNILSMMFGHNATSHMLNQHGMEALNRREDAFNFDVGTTTTSAGAGATPKEVVSTTTLSCPSICFKIYLSFSGTVLCTV